MATTIEQQQEALQTAAKNLSSVLTVHIYKSEDKRKKDLFYLNDFGKTISPRLDYSNMNHFILGMIRGIELYKNN